MSMGHKVQISCRVQAETDEDAFGVGKVADDLAQGLGKAADERRDGEDVVASRQRRMLDEIDDLDLVAPGKMLLRTASSGWRRRAATWATDPATYKRRCQISSPSATAASTVGRVHGAPTSSVVGTCGASSRLVGVGPAQPALLGALAGSVLDAGRAMAQQASHDVGFVLELAPQGRGLRLDRLAPPFQVDPALLEVLQPGRAVGAFLGLLGLAGGAGEHALGARRRRRPARCPGR